MIEYIKGKIEGLTPTDAVIEDRAGVGYQINISLNTFTALQTVQEAKLLIHEVIREDAHLLFGFLEENERELFRQLTGVSGVGANTARMILSSIPPAELEVVITSEDVRRLKSVKGIGAKTAERIIVDLKDKIKLTGGVAAATVVKYNPDVFDEALAALVMLGFAKAQSQKVLTKLFEADPSIKVESAIKKALTMM